MEGVNAKRASRDYICLHVIDIDGTARIDRKALDQQFEDAGIGLMTPTSPETRIPSNQRRNSNRSKAGGYVSAEKLVSP